MFKIILSNLHLEKILWIVKSKLKYMILSALLLAVLAGSYGYFFQSATYMATISFYVYSNPDYATDSGVNISSSEVTSARSLLPSYMQILNSNSFLSQVIVAADLENEYSVGMLKQRIGATAVENTAVFNVTVYDENPVNAMNIANTIGDLAPDQIISVVKSGGIEVVDKAELPTVPFAATSVAKYAVIGTAAGILLSGMFFMFQGLRDTTVRRRYEIEDLFTIPVLGDVPAMLPEKKGEDTKVKLDKESPFAVKEAYNNIRASLLFTSRGEKTPIYAFTSADTEEGKSMNALNVAISYAQLGKKVLLIDADMRKSHMRKTLHIESKGGLSEYLASLTDEIKVHKEMDNLDVIVCGACPPNPAELLVGQRWYDLLEKSKGEYDVIFVDLPPLGIVSDALCLAEVATAYVIVVREWVTKFERTEMVVGKLESLDANICGIIYNGISIKSPDYNYKHYGKEYEEQKQDV